MSTATILSVPSVQVEMFAARFKTDDQANEFKEVFDAAASKMASLPKSPPKASTTAATTVSSSLADQFKPKPGTWECQGCLARNESIELK